MGACESKAPPTFGCEAVAFAGGKGIEGKGTLTVEPRIPLFLPIEFDSPTIFWTALEHTPWTALQKLPCNAELLKRTVAAPCTEYI